MKIIIRLISGNDLEVEFTAYEFNCFMKQWDNTLCENAGYNPVRYIMGGQYINLKTIEVIEVIEQTQDE